MDIQVLKDSRHVVSSADETTIAVALSRVLGVGPAEVIDIYYSPLAGGKSSCRMFSRRFFEPSIIIAQSSCLKMASGLVELAVKETREPARYVPDEKEGFQKGWEIRALSKYSAVVAVAEWCGGQDC